MRRVLLIATAVALLFILHFSVIPLLVADPFRPNLPLVAVVFMGLRLSGWWVVPAAWGTGLVQDAFSGLYGGLDAFAYLVVVMILRRTADSLYVGRTNVLLVAVGGATILHAVMHALLLSLFSVAPGIVGGVVTGLVPQLLANLFVASLVPLVLRQDEEARG